LADVLIAVRALHLAATGMLVGTVIFQGLIAAPVFHRIGDATGGRVGARFTRWTVWISLGVAIISGAAWLAVLAAQISDAPFADALRDSLPMLLTQTQFGHVAELRFVIAILLAWGLWSPRSSRWLTVGLALCFAGSLAWTGHSGAGDGATGDVQVIADASHAIAAAAWVGGLVPLAYLFALAARPASGLAPAAVADITRRFSIMGIICVATLLITGAVNTWFLVASVAILVGSSYGQLLMIKIALFLVMVCIAAINQTRLTPMITADATDVRAKVTIYLARNSAIEAGLGLAVLAIVGALGTLPPELPDDPHVHSHSQAH